MKAIVHRRYGSPDDVLALEDIDRPVCGDDEVLVRVHAASVHPDVWHVVTGRPYVLRLMGAGFLRPRTIVPGIDVAGRVEAVGKNVTAFYAGDEVFGETTRGIQWVNGGAFAEYVSVPSDNLAKKPARLTFEQAAAVPTSGFIALSNVPKQRVKSGQKVLINGAGGGVGVLAVQLAKAYGAEVTAVDSATKLEMLRSVGADHVIDYARDDFTKGTARYDLIIDIPGNHSLSSIRRALTPTGSYILIAHDHYGTVGRRWLGSIPRFIKLLLLSAFVPQLRGAGASLPSKKEAMRALTELIEAGKLTPVVDSSYPLSAVPDAIRHMVRGDTRGRIVITM